MAVVLEFDELPENAQVMLATQSGGCLIGRAVPAGGGGGGARFSLIVVGDSDHVFNADGSAGGVQLEPCSIVTCQVLDVAPRTWKLADMGTLTTYLVFFNIEGSDPGAVTFVRQDDSPILTINEASSTPDRSVVVYPAFFWDGTEWLRLRSVITAPS